MQDQQQQTFPFKLYEMLTYACDYEFISTLSWSADGSAFIIHDKDSMMNDLAPMFFKQTKFRSFTRQLNIWGFTRTETVGGEKGGWKHMSFLRGRHDLLKDIERTEVKSAARKSSSIIKAQQHSSRSTRNAAQRPSVETVVVVADESSCSSSREDSQSLSSFNGDSVHAHSAGSRSALPSVLHSSQGPGFQNSDHIPVPYVKYDQDQSNIQDSFSFPTSPVRRCSTTTQVIDIEQAEPIYSDAQPFSSDDLMYLASIFEKDVHNSDDGDLASILSLDQEAHVEDYIFDF